MAANSNEIAAVPKPLQLLSLEGTIVTVDALNRQRAIAEAKSSDQGGDDAFAPNGHQGARREDVGVSR